MASFPPPAPSGDVPGGPRLDARAVASLVCGIGGLLLFGLILGAVAFFLGRRSRREISERPWMLRGSGVATAGMVLGMVDVVAYFVIVAALN